MYLGTLTIIKRCGVLVLTVSLVTGCAMHLVSPKDPRTFIPDRSAEVIVGQMERAAVRSILGAPQLTSTYWGFDLFCADTEQTDVVFAVTPWPIPFARVKDQLQRYTLVTYDAKGRTSAVATGIFRRPTPWRIASPIEFDYPSLHLRTGELMFFIDPEGAREVHMLAAPPIRDIYLKRAQASTDCMVVLGCGDRGCGNQLSVDAGPPRWLPVRNAHAYWFKQGEMDSWLQGSEPSGSGAPTPWLETLVAFKLSTGEHVFEFSAKHLGGTHSLRFACHSGEVTYLVVSASDNGRFMNRALVDWQINRTDTMPERFSRRPLVLLDDGQWYVDAEPIE
jgi:hypothetical protein